MVVVVLQIAGSMMLFAVAVLAPELAPDLGIDATQIGFYSSLVFLGAAVGSLFSPAPIRRFGPIRTSQLGILIASAALLLPVTGSWLVALASGVAVGIGYGPFTPASTHILTAVTEERDRPFVLAVKQSGAPFGVMLGGALLPSIAVRFDWFAALLSVTGFALLCAVIVQPLRRSTDFRDLGDAGDGMPFALSLLKKDERLRRLTIASFLFAGVQMCSFTFLVIDLVDRIGLDYRLAGLALSIMQAGGVLSRLLWGYLSERLIPGRHLLLGIAGFGAVAMLGLAAMEPGWSFAAVAGIAALSGVTIAGWNGIFIAEVVRVVPRDQLATAVGTTVCFVYSGLVVGPAAFSAVAEGTGSMSIAYTGLAVASAVSGVLILLSHRPS
jgi:predicted MFS family arabinose efflux permease